MFHGMRPVAGAGAGVLAPLLAGALFAYSSRETSSVSAKVLLAATSALIVGVGVIFFIRHVGIPYLEHGKLFLGVGLAALFTGYYVRYMYGLSLIPDIVFYSMIFAAPMYLASWILSVVGGPILPSDGFPRILARAVLLASSRILLLLACLVGITLLLGIISASLLSFSVPLSFKDKALIVKTPMPRLVDVEDVIGSIRILPGNSTVLVNYTTGVGVVGRVLGVNNIGGVEDLVGRTVDLPNGVMWIDEDLKGKILKEEASAGGVPLKNNPHVLYSSPRPVKFLLDNIVGPLIHMVGPLITSRATSKILVGLLLIAVGLSHKEV